MCGGGIFVFQINLRNTVFINSLLIDRIIYYLNETLFGVESLGWCPLDH